MLTISKLADNFQKLDTASVIHASLVETKDDFEKANKQQLRSGKTNTGEKIKPKYRSNKYARVKAEMNPLPGAGVPDLFLTGEFYRQIDAEVGKDVIDVISKDEKGPELEEKYSNIFGLGTNFKVQYLDDSLRPALQRKITTAVGLKFTS